MFLQCACVVTICRRTVDTPLQAHHLLACNSDNTDTSHFGCGRSQSSLAVTGAALLCLSQLPVWYTLEGLECASALYDTGGAAAALGVRWRWHMRVRVRTWLSRTSTSTMTPRCAVSTAISCPMISARQLPHDITRQLRRFF